MLQQKVQGVAFNLRDVSRLLRKLMSKHTNEIYRDDGVSNSVDVEEVAALNNKPFPKPMRELFLWAVLMCRYTHVS